MSSYPIICSVKLYTFPKSIENKDKNKNMFPKQIDKRSMFYRGKKDTEVT